MSSEPAARHKRRRRDNRHHVAAERIHLFVGNRTELWHGSRPHRQSPSSHLARATATASAAASATQARSSTAMGKKRRRSHNRRKIAAKRIAIVGHANQPVARHGHQTRIVVIVRRIVVIVVRHDFGHETVHIGRLHHDDLGCRCMGLSGRQSRCRRSRCSCCRRRERKCLCRTASLAQRFGRRRCMNLAPLLDSGRHTPLCTGNTGRIRTGRRQHRANVLGAAATRPAARAARPARSHGYSGLEHTDAVLDGLALQRHDGQAGIHQRRGRRLWSWLRHGDCDDVVHVHGKQLEWRGEQRRRALLQQRCAQHADERRQRYRVVAQRACAVDGRCLLVLVLVLEVLHVVRVLAQRLDGQLWLRG
ncbi:hypothetical protein BC831DRAFT_468220 [Entophlyctis helioformis]|nr:hypothetical protein BC831DRAFT_468220 [Entophlyctis helioformis]